MRRRKYILVRCTERRRLVEAFVKKVWKCPLSCEPNGASEPDLLFSQTAPSKLHRNSPVTGKGYRFIVMKTPSPAGNPYDHHRTC